jgi:hypothetical protein
MPSRFLKQCAFYLGFFNPDDVSAQPVGKDGVLPFFRPGFRYYVRKKGVLEVGINACAGCHTRVMPDGSFFEGGQGYPDPPRL